MSWLKALLAPYWLKLVGVLVILGTILAGYLKARQDGKEAVRQEHMKTELKQTRKLVEIRNEQLQAAHERPRTKSDLQRLLDDDAY